MKWKSWAGDPLDNLQLVRSCPVKWSDMEGSDKLRFCSRCNLNVYNTINMTREEARLLIEGVEGRLCLRLYRRPDGRVITKDCSLPQRIKVRTAAIAASLAAFIGIPMFQPAYAGAVVREDPISRYERQIAWVDRELEATQSPDDREMLLDLRKDYEAALKLAKENQ